MNFKVRKGQMKIQQMGISFRKRNPTMAKKTTRVHSKSWLLNLNKKSQMKIQQMAFMLIAVMIFFALVGLLVVTIGFSGLKEKATALQEKNAMLLVSKLANSPEFSCGQDIGSKENCIDLDKVFVLKNKINKYKNFWGVSGIEIIKIYPKELQEKEIECISSNYPNCNKIILKPGIGISAENFVSLCRKEFDSENDMTYNKCELGKILVRYEKIQ
ncbi:MAG: hypothetical protein AABY06_01005 [Nanoarchaeota archaeon]